MFDYKDDVLSFNNCGDCIYPIEPEIKDTTDTEANQMTFLVNIEYQNFTRIHIEKIILQVLLLFQDSKE
jgi:hypothetical protein